MDIEDVRWNKPRNDGNQNTGHPKENRRDDRTRTTDSRIDGVTYKSVISEEASNDRNRDNKEDMPEALQRRIYISFSGDMIANLFSYSRSEKLRKQGWSLREGSEDDPTHASYEGPEYNLGKLLDQYMESRL